jgi:stage V sporulation protein R
VTFIDEFLSQEFVDANDYFTYEFSHARRDYRATSTDAEDVKKKLLLRFTNLGKPTVGVYDANYENRGELLLCHEYNGVMMDLQDAEATVKRVFDLWGRPVVLRTITKRIPDREQERARRRNREPNPEEVGVELRYDGDELTTEELSWQAVAELSADELDYDTKPDDWL